MNYDLITILIVAGVAAIVATLIYIGGMSSGKDVVFAETYSDSPVSGLSVGSEGVDVDLRLRRLPAQRGARRLLGGGHNPEPRRRPLRHILLRVYRAVSARADILLGIFPRRQALDSLSGDNHLPCGRGRDRARARAAPLRHKQRIPRADEGARRRGDIRAAARDGGALQLDDDAFV